MNKLNLIEKFEAIKDYWNPKIVGELNGQQVKIAKVKGEFVWHSHELEDEYFQVVKGRLTIEFRDKILTLNENELCVVPAGVEHKPVAEEETWIILFEPASTINTGDVNHKLTQTTLEHLR